MTAEPDLWLLADGLFDGTALRTGVALGVTGGRTTALAEAGSLPATAPLCRIRGVLTAGYLDLQVNGGGDALLNNDQSVAALRQMAAAHRRFGTVAILPTVITDAPEVLARAVDAVIRIRTGDRDSDAI